jgi:hypothetical protein
LEFILLNLSAARENVGTIERLNLSLNCSISFFPYWLDKAKIVGGQGAGEYNQ